MFGTSWVLGIARATATIQTPKPTTVVTSPPVVSSIDKDCADFTTQSQAQAYFNSKGGSPSNNVDDLDRDHDGIACETLP